MPAFMDQTKTINLVPLNLIVDEERERLCTAARKPMRADMVAPTPTDDFSRRPCDALMKRTAQPLGNL